MAIRSGWKVSALVLVLLAGSHASAASMVVFDFDDIHSSSRKGPRASDIESYMEALFGADLTVSSNTKVSTTRPRKKSRVPGMSSDSLAAANSVLKVGKGKRGSGIVFDFGANPIDSFSVDFQLFKKAKSFTILADGVPINHQTLSKAQRKTGLTGHQTAYYFDEPVQTLQFVGVKKKSFSIDNLVINIPLESDDEFLPEDGVFAIASFADNFESNDWNPNTPYVLLSTAPSFDQAGVTAIPEPGSLLLLTAGFVTMMAARRALQKKRIIYARA